MIVQCANCKLYLDDEFRTTVCPHDTFAANDGKNKFEHHSNSYLSDRPLPNRTSGPENAPLKEYVTSFKIKVVIYDKHDSIIREVDMDYGDWKDKQWLGRLSYWAWNEGYTVETFKDNKP